MADPRIKQIKIKSGILKRVVREKAMYETEVQTERGRLEKMRHENRDPYDLKKQEEVIGECLMMIPDCEKRIFVAYNDLKSLLEESEFDLSQSEEFVVAKSYIDEIHALLSSA